jgi:hypothetical protein
MGLLPTSLTSVVNAIGDALTIDQLKHVVMAATAEPLDAAERETAREAVQRTLRRHMREGTEHWLLTKVLATVISDFGMRRLIVRACPDTLASIPTVDQRVDLALRELDRVMKTILTPTYKPELMPWRDKLKETSWQIASLSAYKSLHEILHGLHLKLTFRPAAGALSRSSSPESRYEDCHALIYEACKKARSAAPALCSAPAGTPAELAWIGELERMAEKIRSALRVSDSAAAEEALTNVQRLIRLHLSRLNKNIFDAADMLSLHELIALLPTDLRYDDTFITAFMHAILNLKAAVIARAIVHKIWQDADNDLSLLKDFLDLPTKETKQILNQWVTLQPRLVWLGSLDPDAEWFKEANTPNA